MNFHATLPNALSGLSIYDFLASRARQTPDSIAIAAPGRAALEYRQLIVQIDAVVETLNRLGLGRNDRVAMVLPNGPEMAVAFLAVASAATCAPLNPAYRSREFDFYLSDLNAKALIIQSVKDSPALTVAQERHIPIIELAPNVESPAGIFTLSGKASANASQRGIAQPSDVALILHTSGTTARPKMVPLTHTNLCASAQNIQTSLGLGSNDRCLNVMPLFHIHGLMAAVLASLTAGAQVVCSPGFNALAFFAWLDAFRPTWYTAVPTMHQAILARATANREIIARNPLRLVRSCSSALAPQLMSALEHTFNAPTLEAYGMTEASHQIAVNPLPPHIRRPGSVGLATGVELGIMNEVGDLLPSGHAGEVVIRGASVMQGYANNSTANANAFTRGWFRTGDLGYQDHAGYVFLTGRIKEMINRGGEKISPREVDEVLLDHPAVAQAITFAIPDPKMGEEVGVAVVLRENAHATESEIREFATGRLARFKVPRRIVILNEIPKGATGKVQRIGLAEKLGLT